MRFPSKLTDIYPPQHAIGEKLEKGIGGGGEWPDYLDEAFKNARGKWDPDRSVGRSANSVAVLYFRQIALNTL